MLCLPEEVSCTVYNGRILTFQNWKANPLNHSQAGSTRKIGPKTLELRNPARPTAAELAELYFFLKRDHLERHISYLPSQH